MGDGTSTERGEKRNIYSATPLWGFYCFLLLSHDSVSLHHGFYSVIPYGIHRKERCEIQMAGVKLVPFDARCKMKDKKDAG